MSALNRKQLGKDNLLWGHEAEALAAEYFLKEGYIIRERNWKSGRNEIDLILEKSQTIIFVEVKARKKDSQDPVDAVDTKKRIRIIRAGDNYLRHVQGRYEYRFDIVTFEGDRNDYKMTHYEDAYLPPVNCTIKTL